MSKQDINPLLRFPEYINNCEWQTGKLATISKVTMGSSPKSASYNENKDGLPLLQGNADIKNRLSAPRIYTSQITKQCEIGDILLSVRAPVGTVAKSMHKACIGRGIASIKAINKNSQEYLYQWLLSYEPYWGNISQGGVFDAVNSDDVKQLVINFPQPKEQERIASFLHSIDKVIIIQTKAFEALNSHRQGLMQQLFPSGDAEVPKLRFPEFNNQPEWKKKPFSKLFQIGGGKDHKHLPDGGIPVYGSGGYMRSVNEYLYEGESACIGRKGTINKPMFLTGKFWTVDTLFYTHSFKDCLPKFIFLLFQNINWLALNEAGGVPSLSKVIINKVEVMIPDINEQQRIVDCIFSIDDLIDKQCKKVKALKSHKKGLMQQLFPSMEASIG